MPLERHEHLDVQLDDIVPRDCREGRNGHVYWYRLRDVSTGLSITGAGRGIRIV